MILLSVNENSETIDWVREGKLDLILWDDNTYTCVIANPAKAMNSVRMGKFLSNSNSFTSD